MQASQLIEELLEKRGRAKASVGNGAVGSEKSA